MRVKKKNLKDSVDACLSKMQNSKGVCKGTPGEQAVLQICEEMYQVRGGILYHSYTYNVDRNLPGNIKNSNGSFYCEAVGSTTEIDVLLVTENRIFPIEVKAYKAKEIILTDTTIEGCFKVDKSPVHQNEMHCRHLYSSIFKVLPEGQTKYIIPVVVFVDKAKVVDRRSKEQKEYIKAVVLNTLYKTLVDSDKTSDYKLDLDAIDNLLNECCVKCEKRFKLRKVV